MNRIPDITYEYLLGAVMIGGKPNTWFGSVQLEENGGVFADQLRYRLTLIPDKENGDKISLSYYIGWQSYDIVDKEKVTEEIFSADDEGAKNAVARIREVLKAQLTA